MRMLRLPLLLALWLGACRFGPRVERFPAATSPAGATARLATGTTGRFEAELLAAEDSGLFVLHQARVTFVPYSALTESARIVGLGTAYRVVPGPGHDPALLARLRRVSRFPQGLQPHVLASLLRLHQQEAVARLGAGSGR